VSAFAVIELVKRQLRQRDKKLAGSPKLHANPDQTILYSQDDMYKKTSTGTRNAYVVFYLWLELQAAAA
jgi:hypothetical protein